MLLRGLLDDEQNRGKHVVAHHFLMFIFGI